jgi:hypothetical protein
MPDSLVIVRSDQGSSAVTMELRIYLTATFIWVIGQSKSNHTVLLRVILYDAKDMMIGITVSTE